MLKSQKFFKENAWKNPHWFNSNNNNNNNIVIQKNEIDQKRQIELVEDKNNFSNKEISNDLLNQRINSANISMKFMEEKRKEKEEKEKEIKYYKSLPFDYKFNTNTQIPFEESIFKDRKIKLAGFSDRYIYQKFVYKTDFESETLKNVLIHQVLENKNENNSFSLEIPYQNIQGDIDFQIIKNCYKDSNLVIYCQNNKFRIGLVDNNNHIYFRLDNIENNPPTLYEFKNNQLFFYNHLNNNLEEYYNPNGWRTRLWIISINFYNKT